MMKNGLLTAIGGGVGALLRYGINELIPYTVIPVATLLVNVIGSFLLAFLTFSLFREGTHPKMKLFLGTGFCGGFTTMSTYAFETVKLLDTNPAAALAYTAFTLFLGVGAAFLGMAVASKWPMRRRVVK